MGRRFASWGLLLILLAAIGLMVGRWLWDPASLSSPASFRVWWWETRELDIGVQVGLVFAGALGIAALMPPETEEPE